VLIAVPPRTTALYDFMADVDQDNRHATRLQPERSSESRRVVFQGSIAQPRPRGRGARRSESGKAAKDQDAT